MNGKSIIFVINNPLNMMDFYDIDCSGFSRVFISESQNCTLKPEGTSYIDTEKHTVNSHNCS